MSRSHAFIIEAETEEGIRVAQAWAKKELGMEVENNPDIVVMRYGLLSVADARRVTELVAGAPFAGEHKVVIVAASRAYHEAQNALLKVFEEPPPGTYLFLVLPSLGGLLPTLRSRVQILVTASNFPHAVASEIAQEFLKAGKEKRSALIKKLASGKDEEERRAHREEAITLMNALEAIVYAGGGQTLTGHATFLLDIAVLRGYLYERSAPVRMILEHLALILPRNLV